MWGGRAMPARSLQLRGEFIFCFTYQIYRKIPINQSFCHDFIAANRFISRFAHSFFIRIHQDVKRLCSLSGLYYLCHCDHKVITFKRKIMSVSVVRYMRKKKIGNSIFPTSTLFKQAAGTSKIYDLDALAKRHWNGRIALEGRYSSRNESLCVAFAMCQGGQQSAVDGLGIFTSPWLVRG